MDDCAIIVLAGKELLGWGTETPKYSLGAAHRDGEEKVDFLDCPWKSFGIVPPQINRGFVVEPLPQLSRFRPLHPPSMPGVYSDMTRPEYDFAGLNAGNYVHVVNSNKNTPDLAAWACSYFKYGGKWNLSACKPMSASYCGASFTKPPLDHCEPVPLPPGIAPPKPGN
jgi:hypothetical protein